MQVGQHHARLHRRVVLHESARLVLVLRLEDDDAGKAPVRRGPASTRRPSSSACFRYAKCRRIAAVSASVASSRNWAPRGDLIA
jgi:hypothetical protein